ncbi:MAG TPA: CoA transferase [Dehalococcoidia bacterium]|nr:CoA transferase [Dehalococcoidia bacterium]
MNNDFSTENILTPYRVLDLSDEKGLYCGKIFGDLGADVIKIEKPGGDAARKLGPFYHNEPHPEKSLFWFAMNTSKRGITLDIETADGQEIFKRLVTTADFVIESYSPGYLDNLDLGYRDLEKTNPGIIMVSITPFGQTGPYKSWKTSDIIAWAMGGQMAPCGDIDRPPYRVSYHSQSYLNTGVDAAQGALTALLYRRRTGEGQQVDVSIQESVVQSTEHITSAWDRRRSIQRRENEPGQMAGFRSSQLWKCKDGYVSFAYSGGPGSGRSSENLYKWLNNEGMDPDPVKNSLGSKPEYPREAAPDRIKELTAELFMSRTKAELLDGALKHGVQLYPVSTPADILDNPQLKAREFWKKVDHPELGEKITYPGGFMKASITPVKISRRAPLIGEHNTEIYEKELGIPKEDILILKQAGII